MASVIDGTFPTFGEGPATATAGTVIVLVVRAHRRAKTKLCNLVYTSGSTAHTLTVLRPLAVSTLTANAAASQAVVVLNRDPGAYAAGRLADGLPVVQTADNVIAANDYVLLQLPDSTVLNTTVSSVVVNSDGTVNLTLSANVPTGGALKGAKLWWFGVETDTDPNTAKAHPAFKPTVSATTTFQNTAGGSLVESIFNFNPLLITSNNATGAGTIVNAGGMYGV